MQAQQLSRKTAPDTAFASGVPPYVLSANTAGGAPVWQPIQTNQIATAMVQNSAITSAKIADSSITSAKIADGAIQTNDIADSAITSAKIADGGIATVDIADSAVTTAKIADGSITSAKIADGTVITADISDGSVTTSKIADSNVTVLKIADGNVTTSKIADGNVTSTKIADSNVTTAKVADAAITSAKIADASIISSKIGGNPPTGSFVLGSSAGSVGWVSPSTASIADGSVTPAKLSTGAPNWNSSGLLVAATGLKVNSQGGSVEGGQIELARAVDNQTGFYVDVLGATTSDNKLRIVDGTAVAERVVIDAAGNVGIGTSAPVQKLHVSTTPAPTGTTQSFVRASAGATYGADFGGGLIQGIGSIATISTVTEGTPTEQVRVTSAGDVGIGTASPTTKLDVAGTISTNASTSLALKGGEFKYITCESTHLAFYKKTGAYNYYFRKSDDGAADGANMVDLMVIQDNGNVGIGTSSPDVKLQVSKVADPAIRIFETGSSVDTRITSLSNVGIIGTYSSHPLVIYSNTAERMRIESNGTINTSNNPITNCPTTAKAWVNFNAVQSIVQSYNVSSITKMGVGYYRVNFSTAMASSAYTVVGVTELLTAIATAVARSVIVRVNTTTYAEVVHANASASALDCAMHIAVFGN